MVISVSSDYFTQEDIKKLYRRIQAFSRWNDAWMRKDLRAALWLWGAVMPTSTHEIKHLVHHYEVNHGIVYAAFNWLRAWGWTVERCGWGWRRCTIPANYKQFRRIPKWGATPRKPILARRLTVDDITSMQAQGYTMAQIARHYGVEASTPYQVLHRAKLRQDN